MKNIGLIIVGFGNVGKSFAQTLQTKKSFLRGRGLDVRIVAICEAGGSMLDEKGIDITKALKKPGWEKRRSLDVIRDVSADIVVELTPGDIKSGNPGLEHILAALKSGKHVVTSNKAPLALEFGKIVKEADRNNVEIRYGATVGGSIPVISLFRETLSTDSIKSIYGVLNGTTNFILTKMSEEDIDMNVALMEAQELGIAETDPSYDIDGIDTAAKVAILANSLMGRNVSFNDIHVEGIQEVTLESIELAKKHGHVIKLIGDVSSLEVSPRLIPVNHTLNVSGVLNAILIETDIAGELTLIGKGAGPKETSSTIVSDVLSIAL